MEWNRAKELVWNYGEGGAWGSAMVATLGTLLTHWLGGWDKPLQGLFFFLAMDFLLGFTAAARRGELDSRAMFWGGINKLLVLVFVAVGVQLDGLLGMEEPVCRTAVVFFYIGREGLSMAENYGKLGGRLPGFLVRMLQQVQQQGDGTKVDADPLPETGRETATGDELEQKNNKGGER